MVYSLIVQLQRTLFSGEFCPLDIHSSMLAFMRLCLLPLLSVTVFSGPSLFMYHYFLQVSKAFLIGGDLLNPVFQ